MLRAAGVAAAAEAACGGSLDGTTVAVEGYDDSASAVVDALTSRGATIAGGQPGPAAEVLHAAADVLVIGSKAGLLDHEAVPGVQAKVVVPSGPIPVSAKALAALGRAGVVVLPDFVTTAGHLAAWPVDGAALPADLPAAAAELVSAAVAGAARPSGRARARRVRAGRGVPPHLGRRAAVRPPHRLTLWLSTSPPG